MDVQVITRFLLFLLSNILHCRLLSDAATIPTAVHYSESHSRREAGKLRSGLHRASRRPTDSMRRLPPDREGLKVQFLVGIRRFQPRRPLLLYRCR